MRRAEIHEASQPLVLTSHAVPPCPDAGFLLKTLKTGVCSSDIHLVDDDTALGGGRFRDVLGAGYRGLVPGHEVCGEVMAIGSEVPADCPVKVGDVVIVYPWRGCRHCEACSEGDSHMCENNLMGSQDVGRGLHAGGFATHMAVPEWDLVVKLPENIPPRVGCTLPCSGLVAYQAILKCRPSLDQAVRVRGFSNLLVVGCDALGMWLVVLIKSVFCDKNVNVICADVTQATLDLALKHGADDVILWEPQSEELVATTTMSGFNKMDAVVDLLGSPLTFSTALQCLHHGGSVVCAGMSGREATLPIPALISKSVSVLGVRAGSRRQLRQLVELLAVQDVSNYPPTELYTLDEVNEVLARLRHGPLNAVRGVLAFNQ